MSGGEVDDDRLRDVIVVGNERSLDQDVGFGLRQLGAIATRPARPQPRELERAPARGRRPRADPSDLGPRTDGFAGDRATVVEG